MLPVVVTVDGFRLFFYSNEGNPREPLHVHVSRAECLAKVWVQPMRTESNYGFNTREIAVIEALVVRYTELIRSRWDEHFGS